MVNQRFSIGSSDTATRRSFLGALLGSMALTSVVKGSHDASPSSKPAIIPQPTHLESRPGAFVLKSSTRIASEAATEESARTLAATLAPATGFSLKVVREASRANTISLQLDPARKDLGDEGYTLEVQRDRVLIRAPQPAGLVHACQTLRQLLPAEILGGEKLHGFRWTVPCVRIEDQPRFRVRGLMLDPARHFLSTDFLKRYIDLLALHKMNFLHLHLTDDQSWTVEIKQYPDLVKEENRWKPLDNRKRVLGYYSQAELRDLVAHAASHAVTLVPEIEFTNHLTAALHAYPELMCANNPVRLGKQPWAQDRDTTQWMEPCVGREEPFRYLEGILSEVTEVFPSPYIHVGGDEYFGMAWDQCPDCQRRLKEENLEAEDTPELRELFAQCKGIKNKYLLYRYTMRRICGMVTAKGRIPVIWDDLAWRGQFPPQAVIMQWHTKGGRDPWQRVNAPENPAVPAVRAGHDAIVVQHDYLYLHGVDLAKLYNFEPIPQEISADQQAHVAGPEGALWETPESKVDGYVFPKLCALAEIGWSPRELRNLADFNVRMRDHEIRLNKLGVACCQETPEKPTRT